MDIYTNTNFKQFSKIYIDTTKFTPFQRRCSECLFDELRQHVHIMKLVRTMVRSLSVNIDWRYIHNDIISKYANYMTAIHVMPNKIRLSRMSPPIYAIMFLTDADEFMCKLHGFKNMKYVRITSHMCTFIDICMEIFSRNIRNYRLHFDQWSSELSIDELFILSEHSSDVFRTYAPMEDDIDGPLHTHINKLVRIARDHKDDIERIMNHLDFDGNSQLNLIQAIDSKNLIDKVFAVDKINHVTITPFNAMSSINGEIPECPLCCSTDAQYICHDCKYPICKDCLKHLLKSTGTCPSCRRKESFTVTPLSDDPSLLTVNEESISEHRSNVENLISNEEIFHVVNEIRKLNTRSRRLESFGKFIPTIGMVYKAYIKPFSFTHIPFTIYKPLPYTIDDNELFDNYDIDISNRISKYLDAEIEQSPSNFESLPMVRLNLPE